ncbi:MAG: DinB family protein [Vicinamibacterales bacterium]
MHADQAKAVAQALGQQLQSEWMTTVKVLEAIPEANKTWKPDEKARSAWDLAVHIASSDVWFLDGVLNQQFGKPGDTGATTIAELVAWYKANFPQKLEDVLALDGAKLATIVDFHGMKLPAAHYMVFCAVHGAHHRGQLATYLRPMGSKVPAIYGGSADEAFPG